MDFKKISFEFGQELAILQRLKTAKKKAKKAPKNEEIQDKFT